MMLRKDTQNGWCKTIFICKSHIESVLTDGKGKGKERWGKSAGNESYGGLFMEREGDWRRGITVVPHFEAIWDGW